MNATAATATSPNGQIRAVNINSRGLVYTTSGVLLGDVAGMKILGWEISA